MTTRYRKERWQTPGGELITAALKLESEAAHFGPVLCSFVLYQYYHAQVTEPLILEELREWGVRISSGQLHRLIVEGKEKFHREKDEILRVGLRVSGHVHADDTGARHQGKNGYCKKVGETVGDETVTFVSSRTRTIETALVLFQSSSSSSL